MSSDEKNNYKNGPFTKIVVDETIDTPYPYCILPRRHSRGETVTIEKAKVPMQRQIRSILSVTTWDGRELMELRTGN